ncbi:MAG TPA: hypothetical protein VNZ61_19000 [Roseomonas sp.]|nr:hypothetical protein [Roseomonas sp.]
MRTSFALIAGLGLLLTACGQAQTGGSGMSSSPTTPPLTPSTPMSAGVPGAGTGLNTPIEGSNSRPPQPGMGVPSAGTGLNAPAEGSSSRPPRPGRGVPAAGTGLNAPVQGQSDVGLDRQITRP